MTHVLDACAIIAYLRDEDGAELVESILNEEFCLIHAINLCEVYYDCVKRDTQERADEMLKELASIGLVSREDLDQLLWKTAGRLKAEIGRISLADCFAIALSRRMNAELITSDHHEFDPIAEKGICTIKFIR